MVEQAGVVNVLRTILIIVLVYYGVRFLLRIFFPIILRSLANKTQRKYAQNKNDQKDSKKSKKKGGSDLGEYVDFEEIE